VQLAGLFLRLGVQLLHETLGKTLIHTQRLGAFGKVELAPGASEQLTLTVDPRLLANYEPKRQAFRVAAGKYRVSLAPSAPAPRDAVQSVTVTLPERILPSK